MDTHGTNNLPIPAIVYYINTLDIQLCRRGKGVPTILYVGDVFYKSKRVKIAVKKVSKMSKKLPTWFMYDPKLQLIKDYSVLKFVIRLS